jgi:hypothetical protein
VQWLRRYFAGCEIRALNSQTAMTDRRESHLHGHGALGPPSVAYFSSTSAITDRFDPPRKGWPKSPPSVPLIFLASPASLRRDGLALILLVATPVAAGGVEASIVTPDVRHGRASIASHLGYPLIPSVGLISGCCASPVLPRICSSVEK